MTQLSREQLVIYVDELYHRRRQLERDDPKRDWYTRAIDNAQILNYDHSVAQRYSLPMDAQARTRYRENRLRFIREYAEANPDGFTIPEIMSAWNDQVESDKLTVVKSTLLADLYAISKEGLLTAEQNLVKNQYTYYFTGESND